MITLTPLVLERNDLLVFELFNHFACYVGSRNHRIASGFGVAIGEEEHVAECDFASGSGIDLFDSDDLTRAHPILLASRTNNRVRHALNPNFGKAPKLPHARGNDKSKFRIADFGLRI